MPCGWSPRSARPGFRPRSTSRMGSSRRTRPGRFATSSRRSTTRTTGRAVRGPGSRRSSRSRWRSCPSWTSFRPVHPLLERLTTWKDLADARRFETLFSRILDDSGIVLRELALQGRRAGADELLPPVRDPARRGPRHRLRPGGPGCHARRLYQRDAPARRRGRQRPAAGERPCRRAGHDHPQEQGAGGGRRLRLRRFHAAVPTAAPRVPRRRPPRARRRPVGRTEKGRGQARRTRKSSGSTTWP